MNCQNNELIKFTDRSKEYEIITDCLKKLMLNHKYFKAISFYGIGGIGKSRLVNYALDTTSILDHQKTTKLKINLEIIKSDDIINAIYGLRKQIPTTCPCFDYAIINYWNKFSPNELTSDFSKSIFEQLLSYFADGTDISVKGINILNVIGDVISSMKNICLDSIYYSEIENLSYTEFLKKLPEYLGIDIRNKYFDNYLVFFIDAYEQYNTNWLEAFIEQIGYGVFIITSREKLKWSKINVEEYKLQELPVDDTRTLLQKYKIEKSSIDNILNITECIPIYVELAIRTLKNSGYNEFYFNDKKDIVDKFFNHLEKEYQELLIVLSLVQIFNEKIFDALVKTLNLQISTLVFSEFKDLTIIQNIKDFDEFYKIHDVISANVRIISDYNYRIKVFNAYLDSVYTCKLSDTQKILIYRHVLSLFIQNNFNLDCELCEKMLDLFFLAKGTLLPINYESVVDFESNSNIRPIYYFTKAIYNERETSNQRLVWLNSVSEDINLFGKHKKSYSIIRGYLLGLVKNQSELISTLNIVNENLSPNEFNEWYYGQTKIFLGDYLVTQGKFLSAKNELQKYKSSLNYQKEITHNYAFQVNRHLGHLLRFNMFCNEAQIQYDTALNVNKISTELQKIYIFTNFCETACMYDYEFVEKNYSSYLKLCKSYNDLKSLAKIYCSAAIIYIRNNKFKKARKYIRKSLYLNYVDGYKSGIMFSYLYKLYLDKKINGQFDINTLNCFYRQLNLIDRYEYMKLPIAILDNNIKEINDLKAKFEWLDFERTLKEYNRMFTEIGLI